MGRLENRVIRLEARIGGSWRACVGVPVGEWPADALGSLFSEVARGERSNAWDSLSNEDLDTLLNMAKAMQADETAAAAEAAVGIGG